MLPEVKNFASNALLYTDNTPPGKVMGKYLFLGHCHIKIAKLLWPEAFPKNYVNFELHWSINLRCAKIFTPFVVLRMPVDKQVIKYLTMHLEYQWPSVWISLIFDSASMVYYICYVVYSPVRYPFNSERLLVTKLLLRKLGCILFWRNKFWRSPSGLKSSSRDKNPWLTNPAFCRYPHNPLRVGSYQQFLRALCSKLLSLARKPEELVVLYGS